MKKAYDIYEFLALELMRLRQKGLKPIKILMGPNEYLALVALCRANFTPPDQYKHSEFLGIPFTVVHDGTIVEIKVQGEL